MVTARQHIDATRDFAKRVAAMNNAAVAKALLDSIETISTARWDAAVARAAELPGGIRPEKLKALTTTFQRELGTVGALTGMAAATPAVGTMATLLAASVEMSWFTARAGDLILTIAAMHGRPPPTPEEQRAWVLAVLVFGSTARQGLTRTANEAGAGLSESGPNQVTLATLRATNAALSRLILRRYGTRRGAVAIGTALPLGIGAFVGGSANIVAIRRLATQADAFFAKLPYSSINATATELAGDL